MATRNDRFQVTFEVQGDGKLKATLGDIGKQGAQAAQGLDKVDAAQTRMQLAAVRAAAVIGGGLVTAMGLVIKNTMEAERVNAKLDATLSTLGSRAAVTREQVAGMAEALQNATTFDDEAIIEAADALLKFTNIAGTNFQAALAISTDLAQALGTDLSSAAMSVGKALNNPTTALRQLREMGVQLDDEQQDLIKQLVDTGRAAEAQALLLRELEERYGDAAEAARGTLAGALTALKNTMANLTEGDSGSLDGATSAVNDLTDALNDPDVKAGFAAIVSGVASVTSEVLQGIGILAGYIQKYREIANLGDGDLARGDARDEALTNRLSAIRNTRNAVNEGGVIGAWKALYAPGTALGAGDMFKTKGQIIKELDAERTAIIREMTSRNKAALAASGVDAAFAFITEAPGKSGQGQGNPPKPSGGGGGASRSGGGSVARVIDEEAQARQRLTDSIASQILQNEREIALMGVANEHRNEAAALWEVQFGAMSKATQAEKDAYVASERAVDMARTANEVREESIDLQQQEARAKQDAQDALQDILKSQEFELSLLRMTNKERALAIAQQRAGASFTPEQAAQFSANEDALAAAKEMEGYVDDTKDVLHGFFMDMSKDARGTFSNIGDYFDQLIDRILDRWLTSQIDKLFDGMGNGGSGGGGGDFFSGLLGMFGFGGGGSSGGSSGGGASIVSWALGGYARGGYTGDGPEDEIAGVVHRGEYVVPASVVRAIRGAPAPAPSAMPSGPGGGGGGSNHYTIVNNIRGDVTSRTSDQMADRLAQKLQRQARNR